MKQIAAFSTVLVLLSLTACNSTPTTWYNSAGQSCGTGNPSPGCDYWSDGLQINLQQDPFYSMFESMYYDPSCSQANCWNDAAMPGIWTSPDGIDYYVGGFYNGSQYVPALNSTSSGTKDVDLQRADVQQATRNAHAQVLVNKFGMSVQSASQIVELVDRVQTMSSAGQGFTSTDIQSISQSVLSIAGLSPDEVNGAIAKSLQGDDSSTDALLNKAAQNLGMPSSAVLRNQLLPALGISL
jgi:hypothetical protein